MTTKSIGTSLLVWKTRKKWVRTVGYTISGGGEPGWKKKSEMGVLSPKHFEGFEHFFFCILNPIEEVPLN